MSTKKSADTSFRDLVARLNAMSNMTPDEERAELMEAANKAPKVLDDKTEEDYKDWKYALENIGWLPAWPRHRAAAAPTMPDRAPAPPARAAI